MALTACVILSVLSLRSMRCAWIPLHRHVCTRWQLMFAALHTYTGMSVLVGNCCLLPYCPETISSLSLKCSVTILRNLSFSLRCAWIPLHRHVCTRWQLMFAALHLHRHVCTRWQLMFAALHLHRHFCTCWQLMFAALHLHRHVCTRWQLMFAAILP